MLSRRFLLTGLLALSSVPLAVQAQDTDPYRVAFERLSEFERRNIQVELQMAGLYTSEIDGKFGPGTRRAILGAPEFIKDNSYGRVTVVLETEADLTRFLQEIAQGEWSRWFYGEGGEG